jgi:hypothetical protein
MTTFPYLVPVMPALPWEAVESHAEPRRLTLIARAAMDASPHGNATRVVAIDALTVLLRASIDGIVQLDVERVILDRSTDAAEFLKFLASLPAGFSGDVLLITDDKGAYLSSAGRGGGRALSSLTSDDVAFYLSTHELTEESGLIGRGSPEHREC